MRLVDKVALITGGAAGIGKATAELFAKEGAKVAICDVNEEAGQEVVATLGPEARFHKVDITDRAAVQNWVDGLVAHYGRADILINNAGVLRDGLLVKVKEGELAGQMAEADFDLVIAVNLKGVFNCTQAIAPTMIRQRSGVILNYVATKSAVIGMTKVWARELGRHHIRVNAVAPGFILTEMVLQMPEKILENMKRHTPLGRAGTPQDVADGYLFLASDEASFITGTVLRIDGGIVIGT